MSVLTASRNTDPWQIPRTSLLIQVSSTYCNSCLKGGVLANCRKLTKAPRILSGGRYGRASGFLMRRSTSYHSSYAVFSPRSATLPHHRLSPVKEQPCTQASENTSFTAIHVAEKYIRTNKRGTYFMQSFSWLIPYMESSCSDG